MPKVKAHDQKKDRKEGLIEKIKQKNLALQMQ